MASILRVALVRHGETDWNVAARYQGHLDIPLNANGFAQARALARSMQSWNVSAVYSSDLSRAKATAESIAAPHGLPVKLDPRLREMRFGEWEGLTVDEVADVYGSMYAAWLDKPDAISPPGGESLRELTDRVMGALRDIIEEALRTGGSSAGASYAGDGRRGVPFVIVTSHGGAIRAALWAVRGGPQREGFWGSVASPGTYAVLDVTRSDAASPVDWCVDLIRRAGTPLPVKLEEGRGIE
ncbi:MAG: histidine phosphatase family protein [Firmicutes bacterium]|nr:histidine phosphatase family protein [Bacillota bacterium]